VVLGDEMHEWKSTHHRDNLRQGMGARLQPFQAFASTAGVRTDKGVGYELWEESTRILEGTQEDPSTLVIIFAAPAEADPHDPRTWPLANPDLPRMPMLRQIQDEALKAKGNPRAEAKFKRYHLNQWVDDIVRWLPVKKWDACAKGDKVTWRDYPGVPSSAHRVRHPGRVIDPGHHLPDVHLPALRGRSKVPGHGAVLGARGDA
jgi:phage terminase large subunit-like protein